MFDLNTVLSAAIAAAVQQAIQPLQQEYANKMAEMAERIAKLEMQSADRHERLRVLEGALTDRVAALETLVAIGVDTTLAARVDAHKARIEALEGVDHERDHALTLRYLGGARDDIDALKARVWALENNPAIGVDTTLEKRVAVLEGSHQMSADAFVTHLDNQEWFWEKLMRKAGEAAQSVAAEAISDHCADHDHDSYDNAVSELEELDRYMDDFVKQEEIEEAVNDALDSVTFTVRINR